MSSTPSAPAPQPLASMDEWEDFLKTRYPEPAPAPAAQSRRPPPVGVAADKRT